MAKILLIEDDTGITLPLSLYIQKEWHELEICHDWEMALKIFEEYKPQIIILDINLPNKSGIDICREIRNNSLVPIIVLSARDSESDKLILFDLGVDDYVAKPFSSRELMARISAVLKRSESLVKKPRTNKQLVFGEISLDTKNLIATCGNEELILTKTEFSILQYCIKHAQGIIKRENIMKDVMWYDNYLHDRTIDTHMKNLRKKIGKCVSIETIRGVGYRFEIINP